MEGLGTLRRPNGHPFGYCLFRHREARHKRVDPKPNPKEQIGKASVALT